MLRAVDVILGAGVRGITVHPREDERHITRQDVLDVHAHLRRVDPSVEYNIEGDPRPDLMDLVVELRPTQCTLVPVRPGEITSEAGWDPQQGAALPPVIERLKGVGIRVSVFVEPQEEAIAWAAETGAPTRSLGLSARFSSGKRASIARLRLRSSSYSASETRGCSAR